MSVVSATGLAKSFGAQDVFTGVSLAIPHQARIALVGPNGIGKTTLLRLLAGLDRPDAGEIHRARHLRIGYLPQEGLAESSVDAGQTLWDTCLGALADLRSQEAMLQRLEEAMADPRRAAEAMARYGPLQEAFDRAGGYTYGSRVRSVLNGLGFSVEEDARPIAQLSGGQRTRALLARMLLEDPDLLLLDEPTNHLDVEAVEWLEGWLRDWPGAAVVVSHDRYFLDRTAEVVWELTGDGLESYRGNYTAYARQSAERRRFQLDAHRTQQGHVRREQEYIRRNIAGQNTRQAQGRRKRLERLLRDDVIERPTELSRVRVRMEAARRSGDRVLETHDLVIGYQEPLFAVPDLVLMRGECAALIGPNGAGKTTFLRTLLGEVPARAGTARLGAGLQVGYFAQTHQGLDPELTLLQALQAAAPDQTPQESRSFLARYLFTGDAVEKPIGALSGGERGRLALGLLSLQGANLLLLDEPTNHLDLPSQEVLQEALADFAGTTLLVSHDRYLIDALATQVWAVSPEGRRLDVFVGGYGAYLEAREREAEQARPAERARRAKPAGRPKSVEAARAVEAAEAHVSRLEEELAQTGRELEAAGPDAARVAALGTRYAEVQQALEEAFAAWERLARGDTKSV